MNQTAHNIWVHEELYDSDIQSISFTSEGKVMLWLQKIPLGITCFQKHKSPMFLLFSSTYFPLPLKSTIYLWFDLFEGTIYW